MSVMQRATKKTAAMLALSVLLASCYAGGACAKKASLRYWIWDNNQLPAVKQMIGLFGKQNPDITVKVEVVGADYWPKLLTALAAGAAPDVFWMNMPTFSVWGRRGMLLDLQPYIDADPDAAASAKAMWKTLSSAYSVKGHLYGFPRDYDTIAVLYNEDMVRVAGLTPPMDIEDTWDWDLFTQYARKLTLSQDGKVRQWGLGTAYSEHEGYLPFVYAHGGDMFKWNDDGSDEFVMNSPQTAQALQWLVDKRFRERVTPDAKSVGPGQEALFTQSRLAMMTRGDWSLIYLNTNAKKLKWNIAQFPFDPSNGKRATVIHGLADVINPSTKARKEAFTFVKFMASKQAQGVLGSTGTVIPSRTDTERLYFSPKLYPSNRVAFEKATAYAKAYPMSRKVLYQYCVQTIQPWINKLYDGDISVQQGLDGMAKDMSVIIKRYSAK